MAQPDVRITIAGDASSLVKATKSAGLSLEDFNKKAEKTARDATAAFQKMQADSKKAFEGSAKGKIFGELESQVQNLAENVIPGGGQAVQHLTEKMGGLTAAAGNLAAAGAIGGLAVVAGHAVGQFQELAGDVLQFQRVAGTTAEDSSRWVEVMSDYGIAADQGATLVGKFAKVVGTTPAVLDQYGVAVAHNKDGTVDLNATLANAADVFKNTTDETKKAALGTALFGKSWQDLTPILDKGARGIDDALRSVSQGKVLNQAQVDTAEELRLSIDDLRDVAESFSLTLGKQLVPALHDVAQTAATTAGTFDQQLGPAVGKLINYVVSDATAGLTYFGQVLEEAGVSGDKMGAAVLESTSPIIELTSATRLQAAVNRDRTESEALAADAVKARGDAEVKANKDAATALRNFAAELAEVRKKEEDLAKAEQDLWGGTKIDLPAAIDGVRKGLLDYYDASKAAAAATKEHGAASEEAQRAELAQADASRGLYTDIQKVSEVALTNAEAQAKVEGKTLSATDKMGIQRQALEDLKQKYPELEGPISEVQASFGNLAGDAEDSATRIEAVASRVAAAARAMYGQVNGVIAVTADRAERDIGAGTLAGATPTDGQRASGGPVSAGKRYLVGENGPEILEPDWPGQIIPNSQLGSAGGGGGVTLINHFHGITDTRAVASELGREFAWRLKVGA